MARFATVDQSPQVLSWLCGIETSVEWRLVWCSSQLNRPQKDCSMTGTKMYFSHGLYLMWESYMALHHWEFVQEIVDLILTEVSLGLMGNMCISSLLEQQLK